jgi:ISXO2-like transposase domain/Transposase zinc-ribbon domain
MKARASSFWEWQKHFSTDEACLKEIAKTRWPEGFQCEKCGHDRGWLLKSRPVYECRRCHHQASVTAGTLFHATKLALTQWSWAIYWVSSDKGSVSAFRLSKLLGVSWRTAHKMLRKLRTAMGHQDSLYRLHGVIELDDALIGGKRAGKRGRGAAGKTPVIVACEHNNGQPGFVALQAGEGVNLKTVKRFAEAHLAIEQTVHTDAFKALTSLAGNQHHVAKVTPPELASEWLPWVHIVISNFKAFLPGTYHGVSGRYVQEYLDEFAYRLNRRFWETEIPGRLLRLAVNHRPVNFQPVYCS